MVEKFVVKNSGKIWLCGFTLWTLAAVRVAVEAHKNEKENRKVIERQKEVIERMERILNKYEKEGGIIDETK